MARAKFLVVTPVDIYSVPSGEAMIWALASDLGEDTYVFIDDGSPAIHTCGQFEVFLKATVGN